MEQAIKDLRELLNIQGQQGNWDSDEYMCGMYNGMELMLACLEGREPEYRTLPKRSLWERLKRWYAFRFSKPKLAEDTIGFML